MGIERYTCLFAEQGHPWRSRRWTYNRETDRVEIRVLEHHYKFDAAHLFAMLDTPAGIPIYWRHLNNWNGPRANHACGRAESIFFKGGKMSGDAAIDHDLLVPYLPTGTDALNQLMNSGMSVGMDFIDLPKLEPKEGTPEKPDIMRYGRMRLVEISLTPTPRILTAGILARIEPEEPPAGTGDNPDDEE